MQVDNNMKSDITIKQVNECIIVSKEINDKFILAKNRDRAYEPEIEIVHELINGVEVCYLHDITTDWSEGMNGYGIGIVNTALMVGYDEEEKKIVKKTGKPSKDGKKIREALSKRTLKEAVISATKYEGGIKGHTFISSPQHMITIETTSKHRPKLKLVNMKHPLVRTNHGHIYTTAGYTEGPDYTSSKIRKISAEKQVEKAEDWGQLAPLMRSKFYDYNSPLNMKRDTKKMKTSSQLVLNLTDRIFYLTYFEKNVKRYAGIKNLLPNGYQPLIKIKVKKVV
jgi:hypothetical protein